MSKTRTTDFSIEQIENGYLLTTKGKKPLFCEDEDAVQEAIKSRTHAFCVMSEAIQGLP